jgi:hypothetical protein
MKSIHVEQKGAHFRIFLTTGIAGRAHVTECEDQEQLLVELKAAGASEKGIKQVLQQLETSETADLRI